MHRDLITVEKRGSTLCAVSDAAITALDKIEDGQRVAVKILRKRSVEQNSMYWTVLDRVIEATGKWRTAEELHNALKVAVGCIEKVRLIDGRLVLVPGSIAFDAMSQDEAQRYYDAALRILCDEVMGGCTVEELLQHAGVRQAA